MRGRESKAGSLSLYIHGSMYIKGVQCTCQAEMVVGSSFPPSVAVQGHKHDASI